jgi:hypothetical protein
MQCYGGCACLNAGGRTSTPGFPSFNLREHDSFRVAACYLLTVCISF